MARRLLVGLLALLVLSPAACTWDRTEPGLFPTRPPAAPSLAPIRNGPQPTNPDLPVAGEAVWTTGDGTGITVRVAVHAVRRTLGATVLDWSVTPLSVTPQSGTPQSETPGAAPGAQLGDQLSGSADLGLTGASSSNLAIVLIDPATHRAYRPLRHVSRRQINHCLCTPVWRVQQSMRLGETDLMQIAYPPLPDTVDFVDIAFATLAPFFHVPVTPAGSVPTARRPTDLARPAAEHRTASAPVYFRYPGRPARQLSIQIDRIVAGDGLTAVEWTIQSLNNQARSSLSSYGPPVAAHIPSGVNVANANPASGLTLRPTGSAAPAAPAAWMSADILGRVGYECLCTELGLWARALWSANGVVQVVTNFPALPAGTERVDVDLPGVVTLSDVPVEAAPDVAVGTGPASAHEVDRWLYPDDAPPPAWTPADWPTGVPDPAQLTNYEARTESIGPLPHA